MNRIDETVNNSVVNDNNPFRYSSEYFDKETGTIYLRARYYDPEIARFISQDTNKGKIEDPLSLNLYTYCNNNPIYYYDPDGHSPQVLGGMWESVGGGSVLDTVLLITLTELPNIVDGFQMAAANVDKTQATVDAMKDKYNNGDYSSNNDPDPNWNKNKSKGQVANKNSYRDLYIKENPNMPKNWQVHHSLPQKYESIMQKHGINIHETRYLKGVDPSIHSKITTEWMKWDKLLDHTPTAQEVLQFANYIESTYGQYFLK